MKMLKYSWLVMLVLAVTVFTGCDDDDHDHDHGDNEITINILEPGADEVIADASDAHIHIEIEATDENHNIEIVLHPDGDVSDKIIEVDMHEHDQKVVFEQDIDLSSYPAGTEFHLEVEACKDHDCEERETADVEFSIQ
ncbi:MAG: hypothetical protein KI786_16185 [Mameliella sp.]|nr:hypothetical protein [Phaeodactylibacter sp.]